MDAQEQALWSNVVMAVNRINEPVEWLWDGRLYILKPNEHRMMPKHVVLAGIKAHPTSINPEDGQITESVIGIEGDKAYPYTPLKLTLEELKDRDKAGDDTVLVGGKFTKKKLVNLRATSEPLAISME